MTDITLCQSIKAFVIRSVSKHGVSTGSGTYIRHDNVVQASFVTCSQRQAQPTCIVYDVKV